MPDLPPVPLTFLPHYHTRVWGGRRLETVLGRSLPDERPYGESWELSDRPDCQSRVATGPLAGTTLGELWLRHRTDIFGAAFADHAGPRFPLLIKVLDCADDLSIQVHPPAAVAPDLGGEPKSEMWHFVGVQPGATLYAGLRRGVTASGFAAALESGTVADCVHALEPAVGDSLMVPSGRLHALGGGLLVFEIQQNSDTTYRVFDWNRVGLDGLPRELHIAESLRCIDYSDVEPALHRAASGNPLAVCEFFRVDRRGDREAPAATGGPGPHLIMAIDHLEWAGTSIPAGRVAIWPACLPAPPPITGGSWLEIRSNAST